MGVHGHIRADLSMQALRLSGIVFVMECFQNVYTDAQLIDFQCNERREHRISRCRSCMFVERFSTYSSVLVCPIAMGMVCNAWLC